MMNLRSFTSKLSPATIARLRGIRNLGYTFLEPIDFAARRINHVAHYPPLALRRHVGFLGGIDGVGCEFVAYLKLLCGLTRTSRLLDLGAGCALLELPLLEAIGPAGSCVGVDIHRPCIDWATRTITPKYPHFTFEHADIFNEWYWPAGRMNAKQFFAGFESGSFDSIVAKSLFTHMLPDELDIYLDAVSARLEPTGLGLLTFFLLNEEQTTLAEHGKNKIAFDEDLGDPVFRVRHRNAPTAAVAYEETALQHRLARHHLKIDQVHYGQWSGRENGLSFQDIIIVRKVVS